MESAWLREPTIEALRAGLRVVAPELAEGAIVPRGLAPSDDPRYCAASAVVDRQVRGRFVVKFAWARESALRIRHQAQVLDVLRRVAPWLPVSEVVVDASESAMLVLRWVPGMPFFDVRHVVGDVEWDGVARELATVLGELHDPDVLRAVFQAINAAATRHRPGVGGHR